MSHHNYHYCDNFWRDSKIQHALHPGKCVSLMCLYLIPVLGTDEGPIQVNLDELVQVLDDGYICIKVLEVQDTLVMRYNM